MNVFTLQKERRSLKKEQKELSSILEKMKKIHKDFFPFFSVEMEEIDDLLEDEATALIFLEELGKRLKVRGLGMSIHTCMTVS